MSDRKLRKILCLDGGGVRGLSSIMILRYIMYLLSVERGLEIDPWQEFDMICGTSTGGLSALMLGRMRMSIAEAEQAYAELSKKLFTPVKAKTNPGRLYDYLQANGKFESEPLETHIKQKLQDKNADTEELLKDTDPESCKVFVCAVRAENGSTAVIRSYKSRAADSLYDHCKIWEAARATSAASTFFEPISIGPWSQKFVDGSLKHANPIELADTESAKLWPDDDRLIINIGTGSAPSRAIEGNIFDLAKRLKDIVVEADERSDRFRAAHPDMVNAKRLFRFTVTHGLGDIGLEEYQAVNRIATCTETYLNNTDIVRLVEDCVSTMKTGGQRLGIVVSDLELFPSFSAYREILKICSTCLKGLPAQSPLFFCQGCLTVECVSCKIFHDPSHNDTMLRFVAIQWNKIMSVEDAKTCSSCSRRTRSRLECSQCAKALCDYCAAIKSILPGWLKAHAGEHPHHNDFLSVTPPTISFPSMLERDCHCVEEQSVVTHCDRCLTSLRFGDRLYWCMTCRNIYGASLKGCKKCYKEELWRHESHKFQKIHLVRRDPNSPIASMTAPEQAGRCWECYDCDEVIPPANFARHPCANMSLVVGQTLLDDFRVWFAKCPRLAEPKWPITEVSPTSRMCRICSTYICYDIWSLICLDCPGIICKKCMVKGKNQHPHVTFLCRITKGNGSIHSASGRSCQSCNMKHSNLFTGIQCVHCQVWECCWSCILQHNCPTHAKCRGRLAVYERIIPTVQAQNIPEDSIASRVIRKIHTEPAYAAGTVGMAMLTAAIIEEMTKDD